MTPPILLAVPNVSEGRDADDDRGDRRAFAGDGCGRRAPARRALRPRPPPLGVHARRASRRAGGGAAARRARRGRADRRDEPRRARVRATPASIRTWARSTSRRSSTSTRATGAQRAPQALVLGDRHRRGAAGAGASSTASCPSADPAIRADPRRSCVAAASPGSRRGIAAGEDAPRARLRAAAHASERRRDAGGGQAAARGVQPAARAARHGARTPARSPQLIREGGRARPAGRARDRRRR